MIRNGNVANVGNIVKETKDKPIPELSIEGFFCNGVYLYLYKRIL